MRYTQPILFAAFGALFFGSAQAQFQSTPAQQPAASQRVQTVATGETLSPGQEFSNTVVLVRSPNEAGWKMGVQSSVALSFVKPGATPHESYAAQLMLFPLKDNLSKDEFLTYIKKGIDADTPLSRFKPIESKLTYTTQRGYACAQYSGLTEDKDSATGAPAKLQVRSLYCHHPHDQGVGFMVAYMHRGDSFDKGLPAKADEFFKGVKAVVVTHEVEQAAQQSAPTGK
jgi:hypothetical protein